MIRRPPRATPLYSSAASDVYKRQFLNRSNGNEKKDFVIGDSDIQVKITQKNNKTYVRAYSKSGNIEDSEQLISMINESLS